MIFAIGPEALITSVALLTAILYPRLGRSFFRNAEHAITVLARKQRISVLLCGALALVLRAAILPILPFPVPHIHDEFSFLLAADTFAHGRLTNPTPPMWIHFETLHVLFHPTYQSMYPPLQGLFLAAGRVIGGHPFWGVWLSVGLMCAAICWMLQGWTTPLWALIGGLIPVMRFGVFGWDVSYWGGAPAAIGGALVLGALPRIMRSFRPFDALLMGLGAGILANSRPYEGFLLCMPPFIALTYWLVREWRKRGEAAQVLTVRVILPLFCMLLIAGTMTCFYFLRVTGNPFRMPYQVNRDTYSMARYFFWQPPHAVPAYHHDEMRRFYVHEYQRYEEHRSLKGVLWETGFKAGLLWLFFVGPALTVPLVAGLRAWKDRRVRLLTITAVVCAAGIELVIYFAPHYAAPATCIVIAFMVHGLRCLRAWRWDGRPVGAFLCRVSVLICMTMVPIQIGVLWTRNLHPHQEEGNARLEILSRLRSFNRNQLVFVRYSPEHDVLAQEWVYNDGDIPHAKVVWARDMGRVENLRLLDCYQERQSWLVEPDEKPVRLTAYEPGTLTGNELGNFDSNKCHE